jgi:hypothetical protein
MADFIKELYCKLKKEEIEKVQFILKLTKIDTILENITKVCWKNNIEYKVIIKTINSATLVLFGYSETVVFKYHKAEMVSKEELDFFMYLVDMNKGAKGIYITTGSFQYARRFLLRDLIYKKDIILIDGIDFIKGQFGLKGSAQELSGNKIDFFKYLPD